MKVCSQPPIGMVINCATHQYIPNSVIAVIFEKEIISNYCQNGKFKISKSALRKRSFNLSQY